MSATTCCTKLIVIKMPTVVEFVEYIYIYIYYMAFQNSLF